MDTPNDRMAIPLEENTSTAGPGSVETFSLEVPFPKEGPGSEAYFADEIERARKRRKKDITRWKRNKKRCYDPAGSKNSYPRIGTDEVIVVPVDFYEVEQKMADLFFQVPSVIAVAEQKDPTVVGATPIFQHVLNTLLGPKEANAKIAVDYCLTDVLCVSGIGPVEIGYESVQRQAVVPVFDPITNQPKQDPITHQPITQSVPRTIFGRYYIKHFSPAELLKPVDFLSVEFDDAAWLARERYLDVDLIASTYKIAKDKIGGSFKAEEALVSAEDRDALADSGCVITIWYRAALFDPDAPPEQYRRIVFVEGGERNTFTAVIHENSKYQRFDSAGAYVMGMRGNPITPLTIRTITDTATPPSDTEISRTLVDELSQYRSQLSVHRTRSIPMLGFDSTRVGQEQIDKFERGVLGGMVAFNGPVDGAVQEVARTSFPQENFTAANIIQNDIDRTWGRSAPQLGVQNSGARTATETATQNAATSDRTAKDRTSVLEWFGRVVDKFAALPQIFADHEKLVQIEGPGGAARLEAWDKTKIQGRYALSFKPDSSLRIDQAESRQRFNQFHNQVANSPFFNQQEIAALGAESYGMDPSTVVVTPPPAPKEGPKISVSIKGDDLNPYAPQYANVRLMILGGDPSQLEAAAPPITAPAGAQVVNKHDGERTGKLSGPPPIGTSGVQAPTRPV